MSTGGRRAHGAGRILHVALIFAPVLRPMPIRFAGCSERKFNRVRTGENVANSEPGSPEPSFAALPLVCHALSPSHAADSAGRGTAASGSARSLGVAEISGVSGAAAVDRDDSSPARPERSEPEHALPQSPARFPSVRGRRFSRSISPALVRA